MPLSFSDVVVIRRAFFLGTGSEAGVVLVVLLAQGLFQFDEVGMLLQGHFLTFLCLFFGLLEPLLQLFELVLQLPH